MNRKYLWLLITLASVSCSNEKDQSNKLFNQYVKNIEIEQIGIHTPNLIVDHHGVELFDAK